MSSATPWPCALRTIGLSRTVSLRLDQAPPVTHGHGGMMGSPQSIGRVLLQKGRCFCWQYFFQDPNIMLVCVCVFFVCVLEVCELILWYVDVRFHAVDRCWYGELCLFHSISYVGFDLSEEETPGKVEGSPFARWVLNIFSLSISQWVWWNHVIGKCHGPVRFVIVCLNQEFLVVFLIHSVTVLDLSLQGGGYDKRKAIVESCSILWDPGLVMCRCHKKAHKHTYKQEKWQNKKSCLGLGFSNFEFCTSLYGPHTGCLQNASCFSLVSHPF